MQTLTENLALIPHISLDPNDFRTSKKRSQHKIPRREQETYWKQSFKEAGIEGLKPIKPNWWVASVQDISDERIVRHILGKSWQRIPKDTQTWTQLLQCIEGGLTLVHNGEIILAAQCCSDLNKLKDWQQAANSRETQWQMLWNGHPWLYSRYENGLIFLTDYAESEPKSLAAAKYAIPTKLFQEIVREAEKALAGFGERLFAAWLAEKK